LLNWYRFGVLVVDEIIPSVGVVVDVAVKIILVDTILGLLQ